MEIFWLEIGMVPLALTRFERRPMWNLLDGSALGVLVLAINLLEFLGIRRPGAGRPVMYQVYSYPLFFSSS